MNNKIFQPTWRMTRLIFATLLLNLSTYTGLMAQETLCERLAIIPINSSTIDLNTNTNTLPNHIFNNTKMAQGRLVLVPNLVTVTNQVVTFEDCDIRMANEAGFRVPAGTTLIFRGCRIAAYNCDKLWDKINVDGGRLIMENNNVEDARTVIWSETGGSRITSNGNIFNRNYTGMYLASTVGQKASVYNIGYNTYKNVGKHINKDQGVTKPTRGINLINIIGLNISGKFESLENGAFLNSCNVSFNSSEFVDIKSKNVKTRAEFKNSPVSDGVGIFSDNGSICKVLSCQFNNCRFAAIAGGKSGTSLICQSSMFTNVNSFGIFLPYMIGADNCVINNVNNFSGNNDNSYGFIDIESTVAGSGNEIKDNIFNVNGSAATNVTFACIYANGHKLNTLKIIHNNFSGVYPPTVVTAGKFATAIWTHGGFNNIISNNIINTINNSTNSGGGISLGEENEYTDIQNNQINTNLTRGIEIVNAKFSLLCSNIINNPQYGFFINGNCAFSDFYNNNFSNNSVASILFYSNNSGIRKQVHHGNRFLTGNGGVYHDGSDYLISEFWVNNQVGANCSNSQFMPAIVSPSDWFKTKSGCTTSCAFSGLVSGGGDDEITVLDEAVIDNLLSDYGYTTAEKWNANYNLYTRILANPSLTNDADVAAYLSAMNSSNFATFNSVLNGIKAAMIDENYTNQVNSLLAQRDIALQSLLEALQQCILNEDDVSLEDAYDQTLIQYNEAQTALDNFIQNHLSNQYTTLATILDENEAIEPSSVIEANLQTINRLRIKFYMGLELSATEWTAAEQLAQICTKDGGLPTSLARVLVADRNNYQNSCPEPAAKIVRTVTNPNAIFYPNPASTELTINYKASGLSDNSEVTLKIYDLSGKLLIHKLVQLNNLNTVNISELQEGFYLINLYEANRLVVADKFVKSN